MCIDWQSFNLVKPSETSNYMTYIPSIKKKIKQYLINRLSRCSQLLNLSCLPGNSVCLREDTLFCGYEYIQNLGVNFDKLKGR